MVNYSLFVHRKIGTPFCFDADNDQKIYIIESTTLCNTHYAIGTGRFFSFKFLNCVLVMSCYYQFDVHKYTVNIWMPPDLYDWRLASIYFHNRTLLRENKNSTTMFQSSKFHTTFSKINKYSLKHSMLHASYTSILFIIIFALNALVTWWLLSFQFIQKCSCQSNANSADYHNNSTKWRIFGSYGDQLHLYRRYSLSLQHFLREKSIKLRVPSI